jgi:hypothetical protein
VFIPEGGTFFEVSITFRVPFSCDHFCIKTERL